MEHEVKQLNRKVIIVLTGISITLLVIAVIALIQSTMNFILVNMFIQLSLFFAMISNAYQAYFKGERLVFVMSLVIMIWIVLFIGFLAMID